MTYKQTNLNHYQPAVNVFRDSGTSGASGFGVVYPDEKIQGESGTVAEDLSEEQLLTASPLLYGFSLSDKLWRKFLHLHHPAMFLKRRSFFDGHSDLRGRPNNRDPMADRRI